MRYTSSKREVGERRGASCNGRGVRCSIRYEKSTTTLSSKQEVPTEIEEIIGYYTSPSSK